MTHQWSLESGTDRLPLLEHQGAEMLMGLRQPDLVVQANGRKSAAIATLPSFTKGGPPRSLLSLQTLVWQHLLMQLASFTKGRPTSMVVLSLQLSCSQDLGIGVAIAPSKLLY